MRLRFPPLLSLFSSLVGAACLIGSEPDWPKYRGPTEQGVSRAVNVPTQWSTEDNIAWKTEIPNRGWSSPILVDGRITLTTGVEELVDGMHDLKVLQVDAETGEILWVKTALQGTEEEGMDRHPKNSLASGTVAIDEGVVYAHFSHMGTVALDFLTGDLIWKEKIPYTSKNGTGGTPLVVGDLLVYTTDSFEEPSISARYKKTGEIAWKTTRGYQVKNNFSFGTPLAIEGNGETQIISPGSGMVGAYRPSDGKELWYVTYRMGFSLATSPLYVDGDIYMSTGFSKASFLAIDLDRARGPLEGDLTETHSKWLYHKSVPRASSPNFVDGNVIILEDMGRLQSLDPETGELNWMHPLIGNFSAAPVQVGNLLYLVNEEGVFYILEIRDDGCEVLFETEMGEETLATPAIVDNHIYLRTRHHLWKIGTDS